MDMMSAKTPMENASSMFLLISSDLIPEWRNIEARSDMRNEMFAIVTMVSVADIRPYEVRKGLWSPGSMPR